MLRDFGAVTVVSLTASLLGVMVVLPAALVWSEQRGPLRVPRSRAELAALGRARGRAVRDGAAASARAVRGTPAAIRAAARPAGRRAGAGARTITQVMAARTAIPCSRWTRRSATPRRRAARRVRTRSPWGSCSWASSCSRGINALSSDSPGPAGLEAGRRLPAFAAPSATGSLEGDSNVDQKKACKVQVRDAIRICDYFDRPLVLVAWFSKCGGHCEPVLDSVERIRRRFPRVAFVGVDIRNSLGRGA